MVSTTTQPIPHYNLIEAAIPQFATITLADLGRARLMNRTDTKFLLPASQLPSLLDTLRPSYRWLIVDDCYLCPYETVYYDTANLQLYHAHQVGRINRYKIRQRYYVQSDLAFTEVKYKNSRDLTRKNRVPCVNWSSGEAIMHNWATGLDPESLAFIRQQTASAFQPLDPARLQPVLWVGYTRLTFVSTTTAERLTLDLNLTFRNGKGEASYPDLMIAELKQDARQNSVFLSLMREQRRRAGGLSKYCLGMISLDPTLKQNRFKPKLKRLHKLLNPSSCLHK